MKKTLLLMMISLLSLGVFAQGTLEGNLKDEEGKPLALANVVLRQNNEIVNVKSSNFDGYYFFDNLKEGEYVLTVEYQGKVSETKTIKIKDRETFPYNLAMNTATEVGPIILIAYKTLFNKFEPTTIEIKSDVIVNGGKKDVMKVIEMSTPTTKDKDGNISFRGSRPGSAAYVIDGVRVNGNLDIPTSAISSMKVYSGGIPARYGNTTSAVIEIKTKSYFDYFN